EESCIWGIQQRRPVALPRADGNADVHWHARPRGAAPIANSPQQHGRAARRLACRPLLERQEVSVLSEAAEVRHRPGRDRSPAHRHHRRQAEEGRGHLGLEPRYEILQHETGGLGAGSQHEPLDPGARPHRVRVDPRPRPLRSGENRSRGIDRMTILRRVRLLAALGVAAALIAASAIAHSRTVARIFVTGAGARLVEQGIAGAAPSETSGFQEVPSPGVRYLPNVARATNVPWIDSNGWRFARGLRNANYAKVPAGSAALAAAEAFVFSIDAIVDPDPKDVEDLGAMLRFIRSQAAPPMPELVNIGVVDDGSPVMGEVLNLLTRRNLLFRV